jgi:hypothetical protein
VQAVNFLLRPLLTLVSSNLFLLSIPETEPRQLKSVLSVPLKLYSCPDNWRSCSMLLRDIQAELG